MEQKDCEKQVIEEMAKDVARSISWCNEEIPTIDCLGTAASLYDKCYRKQREGENITEMHPVDEFICSECGLIMRDCCRYEIDADDGDEICYEFAFRFCPRCGAKMKGGAE